MEKLEQSKRSFIFGKQKGIEKEGQVTTKGER